MPNVSSSDRIDCKMSYNPYILIIHIKKGQQYDMNIEDDGVLSELDLVNYYYHVAMYNIRSDTWKEIKIGLKSERYSMACTIHQRPNIDEQSIYLFGGIHYRSGFQAKAIERCDILRATREQNPCEYVDSMQYARSNFHASGQV